MPFYKWLKKKVKKVESQIKKNPKQKKNQTNKQRKTWREL